MKDSGIAAVPARAGKRTSMSWVSRRGRRASAVLALVVLALAATLIAGAGSASATTIPSGFFVVTDAQGANDVPGQVDLTQFGRDDTNATQFSLFWSWDSVDFTGQTGDACALFDYNGNGNIDAAVCSEIHNGTGWTAQSPVITQTVAAPNHGFAGGPPYVFTCSDSKNDRCAQPGDAHAYTTSDIQSGVLGTLAASPPGNLVTDTDPFGPPASDEAYPNDSTVQINISKSYLGGLLSGTPTLVNVCSYPSAGNGGNNNPFDCIVNPGGGFLKIVKNASGADASSTTFTFAVNPGSIAKTIVGSGTTGGFPLQNGSGYSAAETALPNWMLTSASCTLEGGGSANTGQSGNTLTGITVQSGRITTCTFNNTENHPQLSLTKADNLNPAKYDHVGQLVTYTLTATNSGNVPLHNVSVSDAPALDSFACSPAIPAATLAPGASVVCMGSHSITQADLNAGSFKDTASATSTEANAPNADDTVFALQSAALSLTKTDNLNPAKYTHVGQVVTYTLTAKNTGNVTLHNASVSDAPALAGFSCTPSIPAPTLAPGASIVCTGTHAITQADLDAGSFKDTASATSTEANAPNADDTVFALQSAALSLTKTDNLNPAKYDHVGQVVTYTLTATNSGNVTLHAVTVSDSPALAGFSCTPSIPATLAPGASVICTGAHAITQADLNAGSFKDTASATSTEASAPNADDTVLAAQRPVLSLTKTDDLNPSRYDHVGQVVTYTLTATNSGNVTLHAVSVSDAPALAGFSCTPSIPATLAPGASVVCTGTHAITQADLNAGSFADTASATSTEADAPDAHDTVLANQSPKLSLTKTDNLNPAKYDHVGQVVTYTLTATNSGNVTLHAVSVTDAPALAGFSCTPGIPATLAPGASVVCTGTHAITQADLNAGSFKDTASATSTEANAPNADDTVLALQSAALSLTKTDNLNPAKYDHVGQVVTYTLTATNSGNVTLHAVSVSDAPALAGFSCTPSLPATLAPGASVVCTGTHAITQADLNAGSFADTASATSTEANAPDAHDTVLANQGPKLSLTKTDDLNPSKYNHLGQVVTYTLTATNSGNVTLHGVSVSDAPVLAGFSCTPSLPATLAPGASVVCTGTHAITQADLNAGSFSDTASATSTEANAPDAQDTVLANQSPKLSLTKTDDLNPAKYNYVGQIVTYTLTATNSGNVTLHAVSVSDAPALAGFSCTPSIPAASLAPGDSVVCTGTHAITQADLNAGSFSDTGSASSTDAAAPDAQDTVLAAQSPTLSLTKTDDLNPAKYDHVGQVVTYTLTATNTGNVTLHNVSVSDAPALAGFSCTPSIPATLAPGASVVCTGTHTITQADLNAGSFADTASATSTEADAPDAHDTVLANQSPKLSLTKTDDLNPAKYNHLGQVVTYTLTATNAGNVTLHNVSVSDAPALDGFSCGSLGESGLAVGASVVCTGTHAITQTDLNAGSFTDTASATSTEADAPDASDTVFAAPPPPPPPVVPPAVVPPAPVIDLAITKADSPDPDVLGNQLRYTITVRNNGPDTAHNVQMSDPLPIGVTFSSVSTTQGTCTGGQLVSCQLGTIPNGASVVITVLVKTTQTGIITNTATTVGQEVESNVANNTATTTTLVKGPFKPPVVVPMGCYAVAVAPHSLTAGKRSTLVLSVHMLGKPAKNARVKVTGAGIDKTSGPTDARGIVRISVKPAKPGILRFQPLAHKGCGVPRIGVIGAFTPPVTG